jgi:hypothetical protein
VDGAPLGNVIGKGVTQPFMFLLSDHESESDTESRQVRANILSIYDRLPADHRLQIMIKGASHFRFSDDGAMLKIPFVMGAMRILGIVRLDGRRQVTVTAHCISTFFDVYLKGAPISSIRSQPEYPEIEYIQCTPAVCSNDLPVGF